MLLEIGQKTNMKIQHSACRMGHWLISEVEKVSPREGIPPFFGHWLQHRCFILFPCICRSQIVKNHCSSHFFNLSGHCRYVSLSWWAWGRMALSYGCQRFTSHWLCFIGYVCFTAASRSLVSDSTVSENIHSYLFLFLLQTCTSVIRNTLSLLFSLLSFLVGIH